jgi:hypothetical protein
VTAHAQTANKVSAQEAKQIAEDAYAIERKSRAPCFFIVYSALLLLLTYVVQTVALAQELSADARARETEQKMTDDGRFSLLISVMGVNSVLAVRDKRIPQGVPMSGGISAGAQATGQGASDRQSV